MENKKNSGSYRGWGLQTLTSTGNLSAFLFNSSGGHLQRDLAINCSDAMYHVVMTYDGSQNISGLKIFVNGSNVSGTTPFTTGTFASTLVTTAPFQISGRGGANNLLKGNIDDVAVFSKALSASEVNELYRNDTRRISTNSNQTPSSPTETLLIVLVEWKVRYKYHLLSS